MAVKVVSQESPLDIIRKKLNFMNAITSKPASRPRRGTSLILLAKSDEENLLDEDDDDDEKDDGDQHFDLIHGDKKKGKKAQTGPADDEYYKTMPVLNKALK